MAVKFVPHEMQGAWELTPEIRIQVMKAARHNTAELFQCVYDLMVQGAEIGIASQVSKSDACFSDCPTHNIPAYLPGLCDCTKRRLVRGTTNG